MQNTPEISKDCDASPGVQGAEPPRADFIALLHALDACDPALKWLEANPNLGLRELYDQCQEGEWLAWLTEATCEAIGEDSSFVQDGYERWFDSGVKGCWADACRFAIPFERLEALVARAIAKHKAGELLVDDSTDDWDDEDEMDEIDHHLDDDDDDWIDDWEDDEDDDWIDDEEEGEDGDA